MNANTITVRGLLDAARTGSENEDANNETLILLCHALGRDRAWLYAHTDDSLSVEQAVHFHQLLVRRADGEPVAYLTGRREFWSFELTVTPDVLIPRAETELLVETALQKIAADAAVDIADLGTGSGAIALALARERPKARMMASDSSEAALKIARGNAMQLKLGNVEFAQGDWFAALGDRQFDVIVSNPPYIAENDAHLGQGDLRFEPTSALASGPDGQDDLRKIIGAAAKNLKPGGWLLVEHGFDQGTAVRELFGRSGFAEVFTARDMEERERVSGGRH